MSVPKVSRPERPDSLDYLIESRVDAISIILRTGWLISKKSFVQARTCLSQVVLNLRSLGLNEIPECLMPIAKYLIQCEWQKNKAPPAPEPSPLIHPCNLFRGRMSCIWCSKLPADVNASWKYCARCKMVVYCSKKCLQKHWSKGGHSNYCMDFHSCTQKMRVDLEPLFSKIRQLQQNHSRTPSDADTACARLDPSGALLFREKMTASVTRNTMNSANMLKNDNQPSYYPPHPSSTSHTHASSHTKESENESYYHASTSTHSNIHNPVVSVANHSNSSAASTASAASATDTAAAIGAVSTKVLTSAQTQPAPPPPATHNESPLPHHADLLD
jgi:hypothetical protein